MRETTDASAEQGLSDQASATVQDAASAAQEKASLREQGSLRLREQFDQRSNRRARRCARWRRRFAVAAVI
jgi:hypothetical protein